MMKIQECECNWGMESRLWTGIEMVWGRRRTKYGETFLKGIIGRSIYYYYWFNIIYRKFT